MRGSFDRDAPFPTTIPSPVDISPHPRQSLSRLSNPVAPAGGRLRPILHANKERL
jgi:hypothetical protein